MARNNFLRYDPTQDRKSTRLNSSHDQKSYAVFCLKKKTIETFLPLPVFVLFPGGVANRSLVFGVWTPAGACKFLRVNRPLRRTRGGCWANRSAFRLSISVATPMSPLLMALRSRTHRTVSSSCGAACFGAGDGGG